MPHWRSNDAIDFPYVVEIWDGSAYCGDFVGVANIDIISHRDCDWEITEIRGANGQIIHGPAFKWLTIAAIREQCSRQIDAAVAERERETRRVG